MRPVHLGVVELERNDEARSPQAAFVFAPNQEGVVENAAIHAYGPVDIVPGEGGSADDHAVRQIVVEAGFGCLPGKFQVVFVEKFQTSPCRLATMVFTANRSYRISFLPTGNR